MLAGPKAVCSQCHEADTPGGQVAARMAKWIDGLDSSLKRSEAILKRADEYGMEVSEAQVRLGDGRENLVKARLAMHSFNPSEMQKPIEAGMAIATETLHAGELALHEKDVRRMGLAASVVFIGITILAIWFLIRHLEGNAPVLKDQHS